MSQTHIVRQLIVCLLRNISEILVNNKMLPNPTCTEIINSFVHINFPFHNIIHLYISGTLDAILKMIQYEGFNRFYKGMSTKIVQSVLAAAVLFMVKEELVRGARFLLTSKATKKLKS